MLVVVDRDLDAKVSDWVVEALLSGLRSTIPDVELQVEPGFGVTGADRRPVVMVLGERDHERAMAQAAAAAAEVVFVAGGVPERARDRLGIGARAGWAKPLWLLVVSEEEPDAAVAGADGVVWTPPTATAKAVRSLRRRGRRLSDAAAAAPVADVLDGAALDGMAARASRSRLAELLAVEGVEEYQIMGSEQMVVHYSDHRREVVDSPFSSDAELIELCRHLAAFGGASSQSFNVMDPRVDMQIERRWRLHAEAHVVDPSTLVLRSNQGAWRRIDELGVCDPRLGKVLVEAVAGSVRANVVIAAPMSGGKTTLAQSLLGEVPATERVDTIEDTPELKLRAYGIHTQSYERLTRDANADGFGKHSMADHIRDAKRANTDKLVIGEVRGEGTMALLDAMSSGLSGCLVTLHSHPGRGVLDKLVAYATGEGAELAYARQQIAGAIDLLVWMGRDQTGERVIGDVSQIDGFDEITGRISTRCLWRLGADRWAVPVDWPKGRIEDLYASAGVDALVGRDIEQHAAMVAEPGEGQMPIEDAAAPTPIQLRST